MKHEKRNGNQKRNHKQMGHTPPHKKVIPQINTQSIQNHDNTKSEVLNEHTTLISDELNALQIQADKYYIPKLGFNSKFQQEVLHVFPKYGGFKQANVQMNQTLKQFQMVL